MRLAASPLQTLQDLFATTKAVYFVGTYSSMQLSIQAHVHFAGCELHATCGPLVIGSLVTLGRLTVNRVNYYYYGVAHRRDTPKVLEFRVCMTLFYAFLHLQCRMSYRLVPLLTDSCCPGSLVVERSDKRTLTNILMPSTHFQLAQTARILTSTQLTVIAIARHE